MAKFIDRRAGSPDRNGDGDRVIGESQTESGIKVTRHADGTVRRAGPGVRSLSDFFNPEHQHRSLTRGEYLNLRAGEEFARRAASPLGRLIRFFTRQPQVRDTIGDMARAHARSLAALQKQLDAATGGEHLEKRS